MYVWYGMVYMEYGMICLVWYGLVWFGMDLEVIYHSQLSMASMYSSK